MPTSLSTLELTPAMEKILRDANLNSVEEVLDERARLSLLPGMTAKRWERLDYALSMHLAALRDQELRAFMSDRKAQAERIDLALQVLTERSMGIAPGLERAREAQDALKKAKLYADTMAGERNVENVCCWLRHGERRQD